MSALLKEPKQQKEKDWKGKYYQSLDDLDEKQKQWEKDENNLTKSILRLAFSYTGVSDKLDQQLKELRDSLRKHEDANQRRQSIESVVDTIIKQNNEPGKKDEGDPLSPILAMFGKLKLDEQYHREVEQIKKKLEKESEQQVIENYLGQFAEIVNELNTESKQSSVEPESKSIEIKPVDGFTEFLNRLSLPGETGSEIMHLRKRVQAIEEEKQRMELVDETIQILIKAYKSDSARDIEEKSEAHSNANEILLQLIEWVSFPSDFKQQIKTVKDKLNEPIEDKNISKSLREVSAIISSVNTKLQNELDEIENYLTNVIKRLKELELNLLKTGEAQSESYSETRSLSTRIKDKVKQLKTSVVNGKDIEQIKLTLDTHLEFIQSNLDNHLESEKHRHIESEKRAKKLSQRVYEMESETLKLKDTIVKERKKAYKDALTALPNRLAYEEKLREELTRKLRYGNNLSLAVIDIDKFKNVNDTYGHKAGDKVLRTVADLCVKHIRNIDFIARYGGEEFVLLLPETELAEARTAAEHLREEVEKCNFHYNKNEVPVTISLGLAEFHDNENPDDVFKRADKALYAAKQSGRNRCLDEKDLDHNVDL